jgi:putative zinc finger/helix-turn-helix YgiT family protein
MNCNKCGGKSTRRKVKLYHYKESGLPNVYLGNIEVLTCRACKTVCPIIPHVLDLYEAIARAVALKQHRLTGAEARFLRKQLGLPAKTWATYLRVDASTVSRWENGETAIGQQSDSLMRLLYFRLLEETQGRMITEPIASQIASASGRHRNLGMVFNGSNPNLYSYRPSRELVA